MLLESYKHLLSVSELLGRLKYFIVGDLSPSSLPPKKGRENFSQNPRNEKAVTDMSKELIRGTKLYSYNSNENWLNPACLFFDVFALEHFHEFSDERFYKSHGLFIKCQS